MSGCGAGRGADSGTVLLKQREVMDTYDRRRLNRQIVKAVRAGYLGSSIKEKKKKKREKEEKNRERERERERNAHAEYL